MGGEKPEASVRDPRGGGSGLLCANPLHRIGKYDMFNILIKNVKLYNHSNVWTGNKA